MCTVTCRQTIACCACFRTISLHEAQTSVRKQHPEIPRGATQQIAQQPQWGTNQLSSSVGDICNPPKHQNKFTSCESVGKTQRFHHRFSVSECTSNLQWHPCSTLVLHMHILKDLTMHVEKKKACQVSIDKRNPPWNASEQFVFINLRQDDVITVIINETNFGTTSLHKAQMMTYNMSTSPNTQNNTA